MSDNKLSKTPGKMLSEPVGDATPEIMQLQMKNDFLNNCHDGLYDLTEEEIIAISQIRTFDKHIIEIPASMAFCKEYASLSRSRERAGRQEGVSIFKSAIKYVTTGFHTPEQEEQKKTGWFSKK